MREKRTQMHDRGRQMAGVGEDTGKCEKTKRDYGRARTSFCNMHLDVVPRSPDLSV